eukprot:4029-Heterococcus_DN1.PRE.9
MSAHICRHLPSKDEQQMRMISTRTDCAYVDMGFSIAAIWYQLQRPTEANHVVAHAVQSTVYHCC